MINACSINCKNVVYSNRPLFIYNHVMFHFKYLQFFLDISIVQNTTYIYYLKVGDGADTFSGMIRGLEEFP